MFNIKKMNPHSTNNEKLNSLIPEIKERIKKSFGDKVRKIILYGSYARGDYDKDSDVDILVIVDDSNLHHYRETRNELVSSLLNEYDLLFSIRINEESTFTEYKDIIPYYKNVVKEGIPLYG